MRCGLAWLGRYPPIFHRAKRVWRTTAVSHFSRRHEKVPAVRWCHLCAADGLMWTYQISRVRMKAISGDSYTKHRLEAGAWVEAQSWPSAGHLSVLSAADNGEHSFSAWCVSQREACFLRLVASLGFACLIWCPARASALKAQYCLHFSSQWSSFARWIIPTKTVQISRRHRIQLFGRNVEYLLELPPKTNPGSNQNLAFQKTVY